METFGDEYPLIWDSSMLLPTDELDSWGLEEAFSATYYDSSSPDGAASSLASKSIVSERNRRRTLNERLFSLRSVVPNITKMDKASIIKDAIKYIQEMHEQEKIIKDEISELCHLTNGDDFSIDVDQRLPVLKSKKKRTDHCRQCYSSNGSSFKSSPIQDLEMRVSYVGERTLLVSLTCDKREGSMVKLCEIFESLKLKIITTHITTFSGRLLKTIFVEADEEEKDYLRTKIKTAMSSSR